MTNKNNLLNLNERRLERRIIGCIREGIKENCINQITIAEEDITELGKLNNKNPYFYFGQAFNLLSNYYISLRKALDTGDETSLFPIHALEHVNKGLKLSVGNRDGIVTKTGILYCLATSNVNEHVDNFFNYLDYALSIHSKDIDLLFFKASAHYRITKNYKKKILV